MKTSPWTHKKYPGKKFKMTRSYGYGYPHTVKLEYIGPRGGKITDSFFSHQDAKAAGWRKCK